MDIKNLIFDTKMDIINFSDDSVDSISKVFGNRNSDELIINGKFLIGLGKLYSDYILTIISHSAYENNIKLQNEFLSVCGSEINEQLDNSLKDDLNWLLVTNNSNEIIAICSFTITEQYFGVQLLFVSATHRSKGIGGFILSILQDVSIILNVGDDCILPIIFIIRQNFANVKINNFFVKYFFVKPTSVEEKLLYKSIVKKDSLVKNIKSIMILNMPLAFICKDIAVDKLDINWNYIINVSKEQNLPSDLVSVEKPIYTEVERMSNLLLYGNEEYNNWLNNDINKWIQYIIDEEAHDSIGEIDLCKKFFELKHISYPFIFTEVNNSNLIFYAASLICKDENDSQRIRNFFSLLCVLVSHMMSTNDFLFRELFYKKYHKYFSKKLKKLKKKVSDQSIEYYFQRMYTSCLKFDNFIGFDEYCLIANCFNYDVIVLTPILYNKNKKEQVSLKKKKYYLWSCEKTIYKGSIESNRRAVMLIKTKEKLYIVSYNTLYQSDFHNFDKQLIKSYQEYNLFHKTMENKMKLKQEKKMEQEIKSVKTKGTKKKIRKTNLTTVTSEIKEVDDDLSNSPNQKYLESLNLTIDLIESGKYVCTKDENIGIYVPLPYYISYLKDVGVEWPITFITSYFNLLLLSSERDTNDYFYVVNTSSLNYVEPLKKDLIESARNIYVVVNENFHYYLFEYKLTLNIINVYDCNSSQENCTDYINNALIILRQLLKTDKEQVVAKKKTDLKNKNYWLFKSFHPYTVFENDCGCCVLLQVLRCTNLFGINEIISPNLFRINEENGYEYRRQYLLSLYLRLFTDIKVECLDNKIVILDGENTNDILFDLKSFSNLLSTSLNKDKNKVIKSRYDMNCCICKKNLFNHYIDNSYEKDIENKIIYTTVDDCILQEFTIHEYHCDCFKLIHERCRGTDLIGVKCQNCGVRVRADYKYVLGDLDKIKSSRDLQGISNLNDCSEVISDQMEDGELIEVDLKFNESTVLMNLIDDKLKDKDVKKVELPLPVTLTCTRNPNNKNEVAFDSKLSEQQDGEIIQNYVTLNDDLEALMNLTDNKTTQNDDVDKEAEDGEVLLDSSLTCGSSYEKKNFQNHDVAIILNEENPHLIDSKLIQQQKKIKQLNNNIINKSCTEKKQSTYTNNLKLLDNDHKQKYDEREHVYDDLTYVLTYPFKDLNNEIEEVTSTIKGVHFSNAYFSNETICQFQSSWCSKSTPIVKLKITDLNRICNVIHDGQFSINLIKFWNLWISRMSDRDDSEFYICSPDLYSKLMGNGFKFENVSNKVPCNIFDKKLVIMPVPFGKKIWSVCVILNPSSLIKSTNGFEEYGIQLFDVSSQRENELKPGSTSHTICSNITLWVKRSWYQMKKLKLPLEEIFFKKIKKAVPFSFSKHVNDVDTGVFSCYLSFAVLNYYYKRVDSINKEHTLLLQDLENYLKDFTNLNDLNNLRYDILHLIKDLSNIQRKQLLQKDDVNKKNIRLFTKDGELQSEHEIRQSLIDYVEMSHIVNKEKSVSLWLNDIITIKKYSQIRDFVKDLSTYEINNNSIIKIALNNSDLSKEEYLVSKVSNEISLHPFIIDKYNIHDSNEISISNFTNEYSKQLLECHLRKYSLIGNDHFNTNHWIHELYGNIRLKFQDAKRTLLMNHMNDITALQKLIIEENDKLKDENMNSNNFSKRKYEDLIVQLLLLLDYVNDTPFIHAADSIVAVTKISDDKYGLVIDQSNLHLQGVEENKLIIKYADRAFMVDNFIPEFLTKIDQQADNGPWVMQKKLTDESSVEEGIILIHDMTGIQNEIEEGTVKCLNKKKSEGSNLCKIISVRSSMITNLPIKEIQKSSCETINDFCKQLQDKELIVECCNYDWHILCESDKDLKKTHAYESISESTLSEIVSSPIIFNWKVESYILNQLLSNGELEYVLDQDDKLDVSYNDIVQDRNSNGSRKCFYFCTKDRDFFFTLSDKQLCKFRYNKRENIFYGMESKDCDDKKKEEVSREWIEENYGIQFVKHIMLNSELYNSCKYYEVNPGGVVSINSKFCNNNNPKLFYQQNDKRTCAFSSLASILHYFGYFVTAQLMHTIKDDFFLSYENRDLHLKNDNYDLYHRKRKKMKIMNNSYDIPKPNKFLEWLPFIQYYMWAMKDEHKYIPNKINRTFDLFEQMNDMRDGEFLLCELQATDNGKDHAVCINNKYIFDSNCTNAITFSAEALDACCFPGFLFINSGYYFHKRKEKTNLWLKKKKADELKRIINL